MKKHLVTIAILLVFVFITTSQRASDLSASDIGRVWDKIKGYTVCQISLFESIPGMTESCAGDHPDAGFDRGDLVTALTGRYLIRTQLGCGKNSYDVEIVKNDDNTKQSITDNKNGDKRVFLIGDSLTMFGGFDEIWNEYLDKGKYNVMNKGAAGATSSAWKEHFEMCIAGSSKDPWRQILGEPPNGNGNGYGRPKMPPRSIMMIGGNDFHVYKGILQAIPFGVTLRRLNTVHNIEKLITYHHQGNYGCGDVRRVADPGDKNKDGHEVDLYYDLWDKEERGKCEDRNGSGGEADYKDWGIGRLFMLLGNLPAVSLDPTGIPGYVELLKSLGLWDRPNDDIANDENIDQAELTGDALTAAFLKDLYMGHIWTYAIFKFIDSMTQYANCGKLDGCKDHTWVSRQMYKLQFTSHAMTIKRGGVPYVHMYSFFRDESANKKGCWWCADKKFWMKKDAGANTMNFDDGIHINHPLGYLMWAQRILPEMDKLQMDTEQRRDDYPAPGEELGIPQGCDDLCLYILCVTFGICK